MYSLSGNAVSKEASSFMIEDFQLKVALGPADLNTLLTKKLRDELLAKTNLKEVSYNEDIKFYGSITEFKYTPIAPRSNADQEDNSSRIQLTISVEVTYKNPYNKTFEFTKKKFSQTTDIDANANLDNEQPTMVEEVLKKLTQDIFNESIAAW